MSCSDQTAPDIQPDLRVQIRYLSAVRDVTGRRVDDESFPPGATLRDVAAWLKERYGLTVPSARVMAVLMGRGWDQLEKGLGTVLKDGDVIALFPPLGGG